VRVHATEETWISGTLYMVLSETRILSNIKHTTKTRELNEFTTIAELTLIVSEHLRF